MVKKTKLIELEEQPETWLTHLGYALSYLCVLAGCGAIMYLAVLQSMGRLPIR